MNRMATLAIVLFLMAFHQSHAQDSLTSHRPGLIKRYWQSLVQGNIDRTNEIPFDAGLTIAPSYQREAGFGIGCTATGLYRMDMSDSTLPPSNVTLAANVFHKGSFSIKGNGTNYFTDGKTKLVYSASFSRKELNFWGISFDDCKTNPTSGYVRTQLTIDADHNYRLGRYFYFGAVLNLNYGFVSDLLNPSYLKGQNDCYYLTGTGASFQIDTRNNPTNPHKGVYLHLRETAYLKPLGTAGKTIWSTTFALCGFQPLWKGGVLAGDLYALFNSSDVPWILREETGGTSGRMRGYYAGRYIDSDYVTAQIELRQHIASRFGCVAWVGAGMVFPSLDKFRWNNLLPNCGIGLRVEFKHNINLRLDFGFGKETAGLCFGFGEAF